jgi:hypothetical protein
VAGNPSMIFLNCLEWNEVVKISDLQKISGTQVEKYQEFFVFHTGTTRAYES